MENDLISRSTLLEELEKRGYPATPEEVDILKIIDEQPTAYDVEKVVERLERETLGKPTPKEYDSGIYKAIKIVKSGVIE